VPRNVKIFVANKCQAGPQTPKISGEAKRLQLFVVLKN